MPDKKSLGTVIAKLEELFQLFNEHFYSGKLEQPVITVSPDTTAGAYGWCTGWKAWKSDTESKPEDGFYEINICAEHLKRPFADICETLLHEMVHLFNLYEGVKDTSRGGTYHNKLYKAAAEEHGLKVDKDSKYGWTLTSLNEEAAIYIYPIPESEHIRFLQNANSRLHEEGRWKGFFFPEVCLPRLRVHHPGN